MERLPDIPPLSAILDISALGDGVFAGPPVHDGRPRVYGGQTAAQALAAACFTVNAGQVCHSMHSRFLRPGLPGQPTEFEVLALQDTRRFAARNVIGTQRGQPLLQLSAAFQTGPGNSPSHMLAMPEVPAPDALPSEEAQFAAIASQMPDELRVRFARKWPMEARFTNSAPWFDGTPQPAQQRTWLRIRETLPDDPNLHRCALAYASDLVIIQVCFFPLTLSPFDPQVQVASLDHCLWFHRAFRADQWFLLDSRCATVADGRALAQAHVFQDQQLIATISQEALVHERTSGDG